MLLASIKNVLTVINVSWNEHLVVGMMLPDVIFYMSNFETPVSPCVDKLTSNESADFIG